MYTEFLTYVHTTAIFKTQDSKLGFISPKTKTPPNTHYPPHSHYLPLPPGRLPLRLAAPPLLLACLPQKKTPQVPVTTPPQFSHNTLASPPSLFLNGAEGNHVGSSMSTSSRRQVECPLPGWGPMMCSTLNRTRPVKTRCYLLGALTEANMRVASM